LDLTKPWRIWLISKETQMIHWTEWATVAFRAVYAGINSECWLKGKPTGAGPEFQPLSLV
jgi:hypothetical protein